MTLRNARVLSTSINDKPVSTGDPKPRESPLRNAEPGPPGDWVLIYAAPPPEGLRVQIEIEAGGSPVIQVTQDSSGLPPIPAAVFSPRPPEIMPTQWWPPLDSSTVVTTTFEHFELQ